MRSQSYDILILGAGVAGCATALALKQLKSDLNIVIVDRKREFEKPELKDIRVGETLPPQTAARLNELGLWKQFQKLKFQRSYGTSALWGSDNLYHNEFIASPFGYGWHIDRNRFDRFIIEQTLLAGIEICFDTSLLSWNKEGENDWKLRLKNKDVENSVSSKILVDATGKKASLATKLGAKKLKSDQLIGIISAYKSAEMQNAGSGAMVESVASGWWYSSVLNDGITMVCFMTDADISSKAHLSDGLNFEKHLSLTTHTKLRTRGFASGIQIKAAHTQILDQVVGAGWIAVGDSASSYDPLSALGVFKALNMSKYASFAIMDYLKENKRGLARYEKIIKADFKAFLEKKNDYYSEEKRFADEVFWSRRSQLNMDVMCDNLSTINRIEPTYS